MRRSVSRWGVGATPRSPVCMAYWKRVCLRRMSRKVAVLGSAMAESPADSEPPFERAPYLRRWKIGSAILPPSLRLSVAKALRRRPRSELRSDSEALSELLRKRTRARPSVASAGEVEPRDQILYNTREATAYVATRVPGIFACGVRVLSEIQQRFPDFKPRTMLDFGSGPGTAVWAAKEVWPKLRGAVLVEPSSAMIELSTALIPEEWVLGRRRFLHVGVEEGEHDLVVASFSLTELANEREQTSAMEMLWACVAPGGVCVIVEPGTPIGFSTVMLARDHLMERSDCHVLAPCPHAKACPMSPTSWCHFVQRVQRDHNVRGAVRTSRNYHDEKYSYLVLGKEGVTRPNAKVMQWGDTLENSEPYHRLIKAPSKAGRNVTVRTCSPNGRIENFTVPKSAGSGVYRSARKAFWGDGLEQAVFDASAPQVVSYRWARVADPDMHQGSHGQPAGEAGEEEAASTALEEEIVFDGAVGSHAASKTGSVVSKASSNGQQQAAAGHGKQGVAREVVFDEGDGDDFVDMDEVEELFEDEEVVDDESK